MADGVALAVATSDGVALAEVATESLGETLGCCDVADVGESDGLGTKADADAVAIGDALSLGTTDEDGTGVADGRTSSGPVASMMSSSSAMSMAI